MFEEQTAEMRVHVESARSLLDQASDQSTVAAQRHARARAAESRVDAKTTPPADDPPEEVEPSDPWAQVAADCAPFMVGR